MSEYVTPFLIITLFIGLLISIWNKKYHYEVDEVIQGLERQGNNMESMIINNFNLSSINAAIEELNKVKARLLNIIYYITKYI